MTLNRLAELIKNPPTPIEGMPIERPKAKLGKSQTSVRLVLAGGRGSRLGLGPKALVEVGGQRLIDYFLDSSAPVYVMCAKDSLKEIQKAAPSAFCFAQNELPLIDESGIACGAAPCGNGDALLALKQSGLLDQIDAERLTVLPIDNPLGTRAEQRLNQGVGDVVIAAVKPVEGELVGSLVEFEGRVRVVEYLHLRKPALWINTGIYSLSLDFVRRVCEEPLPIHPVYKEGLWKFEKFLFDTFAYAGSSEALGFEREEVFFPIKSASDFATALESVNIN